MKSKYLFFLLTYFSLINVNAQLSEIKTQQIDSLFNSWTETNHPGGAVGIMQNGEVIYSKAFGLASIEYQVPNKTKTIFNSGSISKQFTAMGIVLLHEKGLLSVDDDIRTHLPDLPDFGKTITIRHMLHHTSGLRSLHAMLGLAGWRNDDSRTNEDLYRFMLNQKELNFAPGGEYLYCNTGYMLMVNIIEKVTKKKFPKWMKANIFDPLGMKNTYVEDRYDRIVPNNATSYYGAKNDFFRAVEFWGYVGSGNMHSTTSDLLKWLQNFSTPPPNWSSAFEMLLTIDPLNDGSENNYAFGVSINNINGYKKIQHGGAIGGFRAYASTYPEEQLSIAVMTNFSSSNPSQKENQILNILLKKKVDKKAKDDNSKQNLNTIQLSPEKLNQFEASYWNTKDNYARIIYVRKDTLRYFRSANNENALVPVSSNEFKMVGISETLIVKFDLDEDGHKRMSVRANNQSPSIFEYFEPSLNPKEFIKDYTGRFYSPELESTLVIDLKDGKLMGYHARHGDFPINMLKSDILEIPGFAVIKFVREKNNKISGIRVSNGRAKNVWFEKQK